LPKSKDHKKRKVDSLIPKEDTHPGPGLQELNGRVEEIDARSMLGEDD